MSNKVKVVLALVVMFSLAGSAQAYDYYWSNISGNWADASTWLYGSPVPSNTAVGGSMLYGGATLDVTTAGQGTWDISLGYDNTWGGNPGYAASGATVNIAAGITFNAAGGEFNVGHMGGVGILNVDGTVAATATIRMATYTTGSSGTININNGGIFTTAGGINAGEAGTAVINLNGTGSMVVHNAVNLYNGNGRIDIEAGSLKVLGDYVATLTGYMNNGWITGYNGTGTVNVALGTGADAGYTVVTAIPEPATMILLGLGGLLLRKRMA